MGWLAGDPTRVLRQGGIEVGIVNADWKLFWPVCGRGQAPHTKRKFLLFIQSVLLQYSQSAYSEWRVFMSSNSNTMRSMNQALAHCMISSPDDSHDVKFYEPIDQDCHAGDLEQVGRVRYPRRPELIREFDVLAVGPDRSPNTPLDVQFFVDAGGRNSSGLIIMKISDRAIGTSDHQPIQSRLQIESASSGKTANRVQTLIGLACRNQRSPWSPNSLASFASVVTFAACGDGSAEVLIMTS
jgi:hypothetical protein